MAKCGDCTKFCKCYDYNEKLMKLNEDNAICANYDERVEHPNRYMHNGIECFDMLEATLSPREVIGFYKGCIMKYIWREQDKGGWYDLQKAEVYARRLNEFCARIGLSGDVPHDVSIGCARDTD